MEEAGLQLNWQSAPADSTVSIDRDRVHIWRSSLSVSPTQLEKLVATLSPDERSRAERFRFAQHRHRFIASRGILRSILSRYLDIPAEHIEFSYEAHGKPALSNSNRNFQFNLSHSHDLMLCAVTIEQPVGIDLEFIRPLSDLTQLTQRFFSEQEHQAIHARPATERLADFFRYWTVKEAILKAIGVGLVQLESVEVLLTDTEVFLRRLDNALQNPAEWTLRSFRPTINCAAALAIRHPIVPPEPPELVFLQWSELDNQA